MMANWPYTSEGSLIAAGFRPLWLREREKPCAKCNAVTVLWFDPTGEPIALDPETLQPHEETCSPTSQG